MSAVDLFIGGIAAMAAGVCAMSIGGATGATRVEVAGVAIAVIGGLCTMAAIVAVNAALL